MDTIKICCAGGDGVHTADCRNYGKKQKVCPECLAEIDDSQTYCSDNCRGDFYEGWFDAAMKRIIVRERYHLEEEERGRKFGCESQEVCHRFVREELSDLHKWIMHSSDLTGRPRDDR